MNLEDLRKQFANVADQLEMQGVSRSDLHAIASFQHRALLEAIEVLSPQERQGQRMTWGDESDGGVEHDCLVPYDSAPEGFRLATQTQIAASALLFVRAGYKFMRVN